MKKKFRDKMAKRDKNSKFDLSLLHTQLSAAKYFNLYWKYIDWTLQWCQGNILSATFKILCLEPRTVLLRIWRITQSTLCLSTISIIYYCYRVYLFLQHFMERNVSRSFPTCWHFQSARDRTSGSSSSWVKILSRGLLCTMGMQMVSSCVVSAASAK